MSDGGRESSLYGWRRRKKIFCLERQRAVPGVTRPAMMKLVARASVISAFA